MVLSSQIDTKQQERRIQNQQRCAMVIVRVWAVIQRITRSLPYGKRPTPNLTLSHVTDGISLSVRIAEVLARELSGRNNEVVAPDVRKTSRRVDSYRRVSFSQPNYRFGAECFFVC